MVKEWSDQSDVQKSNVPCWHLADDPATPEFVRYWGEADKVNFGP